MKRMGLISQKTDQKYIKFLNNLFILPFHHQVMRQGMVKGGTTEVWNALWQQAVDTQEATLKDNLLYGLANSQDVTTLEKWDLCYFELIMSSNLCKRNDILIKYRSIKCLLWLTLGCKYVSYHYFIKSLTTFHSVLLSNLQYLLPTVTSQCPRTAR